METIPVSPPARHLVLGTAGHIDHGKTALIKALTGTDTDRLQEEKQRGISIELGYAELELPSGTTMSVVDVPGHEKFVRNMVAGASGIDIFLLVVAADDGVMPQTREHMAIIRLLQIPQGVIAITKTDIVDAEMAELVQADVEDFLSETPYADAPVIPVSSKTGDGLPLLLGALEDAVAKAAAVHRVAAAARLPVDRVFTLKGIGTVITGTLWSGRVCADETVRVLPEDLPARARSIQIHDRDVKCADAGYRVAVNLSGIDRQRLHRGQMVVAGAAVEPSYMVDAHISLIDTAPVLKYGAQTRFHHGTADATAKLMFADRDRLRPGEDCYAQVRLKTKIVPAPGDRFILRSLSPVTTIGGGVVIDPAPRKHGRGDEFVRRLTVLEDGNPAGVVSLLLREAGAGGMTGEELQTRSHLAMESLEAALRDSAVAAKRAGSGGDVFFSPDALAANEQEILDTLARRQQENPADPGVPLDEIARSLDVPPASPALGAVMASLVQNKLAALSKQRYFLPSAEARLSETQQQLLREFETRIADAGLAPPSVTDMVADTRAGTQDAKLALGLLEEKGAVVKVKPDLYFSAEAISRARQIVTDGCQDSGRITLAEFRDLIGVSRRFAQALLEYFDRTGLTLRLEDHRVLRKKVRRKPG
ncbi:MAG: selenocysteine-specific translation elongation factor [Thermoleophilia bacterium]